MWTVIGYVIVGVAIGGFCWLVSNLMIAICIMSLFLG